MCCFGIFTAQPQCRTDDNVAISFVATVASLTADMCAAGVTILAVGTSAPDCFGSIIAARKGKIKMAVSNALGSNIFDCCLCVGLPFLIDALSHSGAVNVDPTGMGMLLAYLLVVLAAHTGMPFAVPMSFQNVFPAQVRIDTYEAPIDVDDRLLGK
eukprot:m.72167 g.72167  ORF g.72167 m.72167 type:complete len:156 (+) comp16099_c0_seq28:1647-2114(+)